MGCPSAPASTSAALNSLSLDENPFTGPAAARVCFDGSARAGERLHRGLDADSGLGVLRYADAGYTDAKSAAKSAGLGLRQEREEKG